MSEFTSTLIIKDVSIKEITDFYSKKNIEGFAFHINSKWRGVVLDVAFEKLSENACKLSLEFGTYTFNFFNFEDDGWGYDLYFKGEEKASLFINYDTSIRNNMESNDLTTQNPNLSLLNEIASKKEEIDKLQEYLNDTCMDVDKLFQGVEYFKQAFELDSISFVSFEYFSSLSSKALKEFDAKHFRSAGAVKNLKKSILKGLEGRLNQLGYYFDKEESGPNEFAFLQVENGFKKGLILTKEIVFNDKNERVNRIEPCLRAPVSVSGTNLYYRTEGVQKIFEYNSEAELNSALEQIFNQFVKRGLNWIAENSLKMFNAHKFYEDIVDNFFKKFTFKRVYTDENLLAGGKVIYSNGEVRVVFNHNWLHTNVSCRIVEAGTEKFLFDIAKEHNAEKLMQKNGYRNEEEYKKYINSCLPVLEQYYFPSLRADK